MNPLGIVYQYNMFDQDYSIMTSAEGFLLYTFYVPLMPSVVTQLSAKDISIEHLKNYFENKLLFDLS